MAREDIELGRMLEKTKQAAKDLQNADLFREVFSEACSLLRLEDSDVSAALPVDRTTVNRWRNGASVPRPLMRKPIYRFLAARLQRQIALRSPGSPASAEAKKKPLAG